MQKGIRNFRSCSRDVSKVLTDFYQRSVEAVVLDLRNNGGGYLEEAIRVAGLFIDTGPIVQVRSSDSTIQVYNDREPGTKWDGPLVVLTNSSSASASEIVVGAIQEYRRGVVVGDRQTHGKGTVQTPLRVVDALLRQELPNYGALKVTVQAYYLPSGRSTQIDGVASDITLPSARAFARVVERELEYALPNDRVPEVDHFLYDVATSEVITQLRAASARRVSKSDGFARTIRQSEAVRRRQDERLVPVLKSKFDAIRESYLANGYSGQEEPSDGVFPRDDYEREVIKIAQDYVDELATREESSVERPRFFDKVDTGHKSQERSSTRLKGRTS